MAESWVAMIQGAETGDRSREIWATMRKYRAEPYVYVDLFIARYEAVR
jgi:hypothetical protein